MSVEEDIVDPNRDKADQHGSRDDESAGNALTIRDLPVGLNLQVVKRHSVEDDKLNAAVTSGDPEAVSVSQREHHKGDVNGHMVSWWCLALLCDSGC